MRAVLVQLRGLYVEFDLDLFGHQQHSGFEHLVPGQAPVLAVDAGARRGGPAGASERIPDRLADLRVEDDLARAVGGVNTTTLSARLERLDRMGIVVKTVESTMPPKTRYELSDAGRALHEVIDAIDGWARRHMQRCREREAETANVARTVDA